MLSKTLSALEVGLDILEKDLVSILKGKRVGVIVNHTSVNSKGKHIIDILIEKEINLVRIFAPEHGFLGNQSAGKKIDDDFNPFLGVEIVSLYGKNKSPQEQHLENLDVLIFDIQDIGVRYYTYVSTMTLAMIEAAKNNLKFIVLDRPNPLNGVSVEGSVSEISSFVGMHPMPVRHGMTIGEIAVFIKQNNLIENAINLDLKVIKMKGWNRKKMHSRRLGEWIAPSPNIPDVKTALMYVGTCLLEGTNVSEGRGTDIPFMLFGSPWLDNEKVLKALKGYKFKGVKFYKYNFTPISIYGKSENPKYKDQYCKGIKIKITDKNRISPFEIGLAIISEIYANNSENFKFKDNFFDKLYGRSDLRLSMLDMKDIDSLVEKNERDIEDFKKLREKVLLYD